MMKKKILILILFFAAGIGISFFAAGVGISFISQKLAFPEPKIPHYNVFVVHFEPRSADERAFERFKEWVVFAKKRNQKFSLGFTPQWVEMILKDPVKLSFVQELFKEGWDMAPQHHGPHHGWDWDGYCDYGADRCMKLRKTFYRSHPSPIMKWWYAEKEQYKGNMNDYMKLMTKLYPFKVMVMGPDKFFDWPSGIQFSMDKALFTFPSGQPNFDEPVGMEIEGTSGLTHFEKKELNGKTVYECGARAILTRDALEKAKKDYKTLQKTGKENEFMATIIHIEDDEALFKNWIKYLHSQDPNGIYNKGITEIANKFLEKSQEKISIDSPFGMHGALSRPFIESDNVSHAEILRRIHEEKALYRHVQDIGIKWIRPGADIYWRAVQPTIEHKKNGIFNWRSIDDLYGRVPSGVNILGTIDPLLWSWGLNVDSAFKLGTWQFASIEEEKSYIKFVKETVERYDGDGYKDMPELKNPIKYWQIGNEPAMRQIEIMDLNKKLDWEGFGHIVEISYQAIKESDAEAKIALAGLAVGYPILDNPFFGRELDEFYIPLMQNLSGRYIDVFDIHYYGNAQKGSDGWGWQEMRNTSNWMRQILNQNGYQNTEIWFTETAVPSEPFGERFQAINLFKRYVYPLSFGVKKVFWWNMIEGEYPLEVDKPNNHFGLVYDGIGKDDPGYGVKKLAYYTYKKMVEILEGSDWENIQTIQEKDGIYIYKFTKQGKSIWVAWNENSQEKQITISGINTNQIKITEAVPRYESGKDVIDYSTAFKTETKSVNNSKVTIILEDKPVFVEEK